MSDDRRRGERSEAAVCLVREGWRPAHAAACVGISPAAVYQRMSRDGVTASQSPITGTRRGRPPANGRLAAALDMVARGHVPHRAARAVGIAGSVVTTTMKRRGIEARHVSRARAGAEMVAAGFTVTEAARWVGAYPEVVHVAVLRAERREHKRARD